jgi:hypothetical protein
MKSSKSAIFAGVSVAAGIAWFLLAKGPDAPPAVQPDRTQAPEPAGEPKTAERQPVPAPLPPAPPVDDEQDLMAKIRAPWADPATVLLLAREGNGTHPDSPFAEERAAKAIDALVSLNRIGEAHHEAELFIERWPTGERATHVMNLMGVHPRPRH